MFKKKKFLVGGLVIFFAIGYLGFLGFQKSATFYFTVSELAEQGNSIYGENVRVNGQVVPGSVEKEAAGRLWKFTITEGGTSLLVVYQGVMPDTFKEGNEVVVEGQLNGDGNFLASTVMPKCPSRYAPEEQASSTKT